MNFLETLWSIVLFVVFVSYLVMLFHIVTDLFRDRDLQGWVKALWFLLLLVLPILTALIYLIVRGTGMAARNEVRAMAAEAAVEDRIRSIATTPSTPARQIADAQALLDSGGITEEDFRKLKAKALG